jgi:hypothetical protein
MNTSLWDMKSVYENQLYFYTLNNNLKTKLQKLHLQQCNKAPRKNFNKAA